MMYNLYIYDILLYVCWELGKLKSNFVPITFWVLDDEPIEVTGWCGIIAHHIKLITFMRFAMNKFHKTLAKNCAGAPQIHRILASINTNTSCKNTNTSCLTQTHQQKRPIHNAKAANTSRHKHKKHVIPKLRIVPGHLIPSQVVSKHKDNVRAFWRVFTQRQSWGPAKVEEKHKSLQSSHQTRLTKFHF